MCNFERFNTRVHPHSKRNGELKTLIASGYFAVMRSGTRRSQCSLMAGTGRKTGSSHSVTTGEAGICTDLPPTIISRVRN